MLIYNKGSLAFLYGRYVPFVRLKVTSKKLTILRFLLISILNSTCLKIFGAFPADSKQRISFGGSGAVCGILLFGQACYSFNQYNLQDGMLPLISKPILY